MTKIFLAVWLLFLTSCASRPIRPAMPSHIDHRRGFHSPALESITFFAMNDLHGNLRASDKQGGVLQLSSYLDAARSYFGKRLLVLDAGNLWQGSSLSELDGGQGLVGLYNKIGVTAVLAGIHEFGTERKQLVQNLKTARFPFVVSNLSDSSTGKYPKFPNLTRSTIVQAGSVRVGLVGLISPKKFSLLVHPSLENFHATDPAPAGLEQAHALRAQGANMVVLLANLEVQCEVPAEKGTGEAVQEPPLWNENDGQAFCGQSELEQLLGDLPHGTFDLVIAGYSHGLVHHWVHGTPVVQSGHSGMYFHLAYLSYDHARKAMTPSLTHISGPIPTCDKVRTDLDHCDADRSSGLWVTPTFFGSLIESNKALEKEIDRIMSRNRDKLHSVLARSDSTLYFTPTEESPLGNLVADALRASVGVDVALVHPGAFRAPLPEGAVTTKDLFEALPFNMRLSRLDLSGTELKTLIRIVNSGGRGFYSFSGLRVKALNLKSFAPSTDLDKSGRISSWEVDRVLDVQLADGRAIQDRGRYSVALPEFLAKGGDDLSWWISHLDNAQIRLDTGYQLREAVSAHLVALGRINTTKTPLIRPEAPRLKLVALTRLENLRKHRRQN